MDLDPLLLSRIQFGFVVSFHILFPAFTIGLASFIAVLEGLWVFTGQELYVRVSRFWTQIFAVSFGMGVVSGIVMTYQFGTNWGRFSAIAGNVVGPILSYEVVTAFFMEATFLGVMLFGRRLVPPPLHFLSAVMVALGTLLSAFWILSANSWMQTPVGYAIRDGVFFPVDWWAIVFNPSFPYRLVHMVTAAYLTTAFVAIGVSAWYLLNGRHPVETRKVFSMTLWLVAVLAPLQILLGDLHGLNTLDHQPVKIAAMEGHWDGGPRAPLILFAIPDMAAEANRLELAIPALSSLILTHELEGAVPGLKDYPPELRPYVPLVFATFRIMVGIGFVMLFVAMAGLVLRVRGRLFEARWFHRLCLLCAPLGFVAVLCGWITTEHGRQPWVVYDLVRTSDAVSPGLAGGTVLASLLVFLAAYAVVFSAGTYYILKLIQTGPEAGPVAAGGPWPKTPKRPLSVPEQPVEP